MGEVRCKPLVIKRHHVPFGKEHGLPMFFVHCDWCGELSQWFLEEKYADMWVDKHKLLMATGVRNPTKSLTSPRPETVYKQYRILEVDERYDHKDRLLFKQMADELEGRVKTGEPDPDQLELF